MAEREETVNVGGGAGRGGGGGGAGTGGEVRADQIVEPEAGKGASADTPGNDPTDEARGTVGTGGQRNLTGRNVGGSGSDREG